MRARRMHAFACRYAWWMCVCVCVCVCVYMCYVCVYTCAFTVQNPYLCRCVCVYVSIWYKCIHTYLYARTHAHIHTQICTYKLCRRNCIFVYIRIGTVTNIKKRSEGSVMNAQTHTHSPHTLTQALISITLYRHAHAPCRVPLVDMLHVFHV